MTATRQDHDGLQTGRYARRHRSRSGDDDSRDDWNCHSSRATPRRSRAGNDAPRAPSHQLSEVALLTEAAAQARGICCKRRSSSSVASAASAEHPFRSLGRRWWREPEAEGWGGGRFYALTALGGSARDLGVQQRRRRRAGCPRLPPGGDRGRRRPGATDTVTRPPLTVKIVAPRGPNSVLVPVEKGRFHAAGRIMKWKAGNFL